MTDNPAAIDITLSMLFFQDKTCGYAENDERKSAVHAKYAFQPASLILYGISGLTGAWLKKADNVRETRIIPVQSGEVQSLQNIPIPQLRNYGKGYKCKVHYPCIRGELRSKLT